MKNLTPNQIVSSITNALAKGTVFAGFNYPTKHGTIKRRNVTIGASLKRYIAGDGKAKRGWGKTFGRGALVQKDEKFYIQGIENNLDSGPQLKRFSLDKVTDFVIG